MKLVSIVGARPQFIKLAPLCREINQNYPSLRHIILHTGQHYDKIMSESFFEELQIPEPDYNLNIGSGNQGSQTGRMLEIIEQILIDEKPDGIIVFGDTNSTLAGSLAAVKLGIKSFHIEAGLRSFNRSMPEEINRIVTDHTCDWLYVPTKTGLKNLETEGLLQKAFLTGDIMVDSLKHNLQMAIDQSRVLELFSISNPYILLTLHRPYNVDDPQNLAAIFDKLSSSPYQFIFPIHPRTGAITKSHHITFPSNVKTIPPQAYLDFIKLQYHADKILTDSGGIQKEAYILKKPCITLRPESEWIETIEDGWNILVDYKQENFPEIIANFKPSGIQSNVFGENVARKIMEHIIEHL